MKLKYILPILFLPVLFACRSKKALIEENKKLKSQIVQYRQGLDTIKANLKKDVVLVTELKSHFQEMSETISRLEAENMNLKYNLQEAEEKLKKLEKPILAGLSVFGVDTTHSKSKFYVENNHIGQFQLIRIQFKELENPAITIPLKDTVWIGMEDSLHHEIPIINHSKPELKKGNMAGIEIVGDGELKMFKYYFIPTSGVQLTPGFYRFSLHAGGRLIDLYGLRFQ